MERPRQGRVRRTRQPVRDRAHLERHHALKITTTALALALLAATSFGSHAVAQQGGVEVGGNLNNLTLVGRNTNAAIRVNTKACSEIGNIDKSDVCD